MAQDDTALDTKIKSQHEMSLFLFFILLSVGTDADVTTEEFIVYILISFYFLVGRKRLHCGLFLMPSGGVGERAKSISFFLSFCVCLP